MRAIDVSKYQGNINWQKVKDAAYIDGERVSYALIKCGQADYLDFQWPTNWRNAKVAGLPRGAYWFGDHRYDPISQAWLFWKTIKDDPGEVLPTIDVEYPSGGQTREHFNTLMKIVYEFESISGIRPMIYTGAWWWNKVTDGEDYSRYVLWAASYTNSLVLPKGWTSAAVWQYSDQYQIAGIVGNVDANKILDEDAILMKKADVPTQFPAKAKTTKATAGFRSTSQTSTILYTMNIAGVDSIVHGISNGYALTSMESMQAWVPLTSLQFAEAPNPPPPPPPLPLIAPRLGYNVLNAGYAMRMADNGTRFFMLMDMGVARAIKKKYPDATVMVRWYHGNRRIVPMDVIKALSPSLDDELVFTGLNECDWQCYGTPAQIRERAMFDVSLAKLLAERSPKSDYAAGTFSMGTPDFTSQDICDAMRTHYASHYNSGLFSYDYHSYTPSLTTGFDEWYARRWEFLFTKCGFDASSLSRIYCGETGLDDTHGHGFIGVGATQAQVNDWCIKWKALQSKPMANGLPSPVVGGAVFCLGENGDKRWLPFKADGYEVFR